MCPHRPNAKQARFLALDDVEEVMYGGAAGGGKTDALLMAAVQYAHVPGYSALILRREMVDALQPDSILFRAHTWWDQIARFSPKTNTFTFPSGATITFGHMQHERDKLRYQGSAFQFIGFDELTHFTETQYLYLFSRLRRLVGMNVPLRARAATNPGGPGHSWVKSRFVSDDAERCLVDGIYDRVFYVGDRAFVPARVEDNTAMDLPSYLKNLDKLDPVTRARLKLGDWRAAEEGLVDPAWLRDYRVLEHEYHLFDNEHNFVRSVLQSDARRYQVIDAGGTSKELAEQHKNARPSNSVITTFDYYHHADGWRAWIIVNCRAGLYAFPQLVAAAREEAERFAPLWIGVEDKNQGRALWETLREELPMVPLEPGSQDKATRAAPALNAMYKGEVYFPEEAPWRPAFMDELLFWQGLPEQQDDRIDTLAYGVDRVLVLAGSPRGAGSDGPFVGGGIW